MADCFNLAIQCSGSHISLNAESLKPCAEGSFQQKSFTNIWVWFCFGLVFCCFVFFFWHQCYCALLLWAPLLQEIGGITRLRFRDRNGQKTLGCEVVLSVLVFSNLGTTKKWQMAVWWSLPTARESRQALAHSKSRYTTSLNAGPSEEQRHLQNTDAQSQTGAPLLLATRLVFLKLFWCFFWNLHSDN